MKREIFIGPVGIGGNHPVSIQSMISRPITAVAACIDQINALKKSGCDIVRLGIPDRSSLKPLSAIIAQTTLPLIADIHFDSYLAQKALELGVQGLRINPGNIGSRKKLQAILQSARERKIPIRIGINSGSIDKKIQGLPLSLAEKMVRSALDQVKFFEDCDFFDLKISLKSSDVRETVQAYRLIDSRCDYPLHLGITEAGTFLGGTIKSSIGIGSLLLDGIGQTIRVSLTEDPVQEVRVAREILKALGLRRQGIDFISCPTCSRTSVDLIEIAKTIESTLQTWDTQKFIRVAVMGCEVNGPGEARDADIGLAFSKNRGFIFKKGEPVEKVSIPDSIPKFLQYIREMLEI